MVIFARVLFLFMECLVWLYHLQLIFLILRAPLKNLHFPLLRHKLDFHTVLNTRSRWFEWSNSFFENMMRSSKYGRRNRIYLEKNSVHQSFKCCWDVGQSNYHSIEFIMAPLKWKSREVGWSFVHFYLKISRTCIESWQYSRSVKSVEYFIYLGQSISVFDCFEV